MSASEPESFNTLFVNHGVGSDGFSRPNVDLIWRVAVREAERAFGKRLTAPTSTELQYIEAIVLWTDEYFQSLESVYYSGFYRTAKGKQLDRLLSLMGYERLPERQATGEVTFTASGGAGGAPSEVVIPAGTRITTTRREDVDRVIFQTTEPAVIPQGATEVTQVPVRGLDPKLTELELSDEQRGEETNIAADTLDTFYDAISGVVAVTNPLPTGGSGTRSDDSEYKFVSGRDKETDIAFKRRYEAAQGLGGAATLTAVTAALRNAGDGTIVSDVDVDETLQITDNGDGTYSGRQIEPLVALADDTAANRDAVGQAIYDSRAAGIRSVGPTEVFAERSDGTTHNQAEGFTIVTETEIYVQADILVTDTFPSDGKDEIKSNVLEIIGGYLADGSRVSGRYGGIGGDVYYSQVTGAVMDNDINGLLDVDGTSMTDAIMIGTADPPTGTSNVTIADDEMAVVRPSNITINTNTAQPQ